MAMIIGVTTVTTAVFDVISVRNDTKKVTSSVIIETGKGDRTVSWSPRNFDSPDTYVYSMRTWNGF